jgi:hypothetical protein
MAASQEPDRVADDELDVLADVIEVMEEAIRRLPGDSVWVARLSSGRRVILQQLGFRHLRDVPPARPRAPEREPRFQRRSPRA